MKLSNINLPESSEIKCKNIICKIFALGF